MKGILQTSLADGRAGKPGTPKKTEPLNRGFFV